VRRASLAGEHQRMFRCILITVGLVALGEVLPALQAQGVVQASPRRSVQTGDLAGRFRAIVEEERERSQTPGISAALVVDGVLVAEVASGLADRETGAAVTPETAFGAASVSKLFTAALVMQQVERGKLSLDIPANHWLDPSRQIRDANGQPVDATVRQLLTHTSGLPIAWSSPDEETFPLAEFLATGLRVVRSPGQKIVYANGGYALLGYLAARANSEEFSAYAQRELLQPLGMTRSSFSRADLKDPFAAGYGTMFGGNSRVDPQLESVVNPAGSLVTIPRDLLRFARMILQRGELDGVRILATASVEDMLRLQARNLPVRDEGYGLGFMVRERGGRKAVWHDGDSAGAASRLMLLPEYGAAVAILSNRADHDPVNRIARRTADLVAGPEKIATPSVDSSLSSFAGTYRMTDSAPARLWPLELFFNLEVRAVEGALRANIPFTDQAMDLEPLGPSRFRMIGGMWDNSTVVFEDDRLVAGFIEARRIAAWQGARAIAAYVVILALAGMSTAIALGFRRNLRATGGLQWGRVLTGGFVSEGIIFAAGAAAFMRSGGGSVDGVLLVASFATPLALGLWIARGVDSRFVLHGTLIGIVAVVFHLVVFLGRAEPPLYTAAHALKIAGGAFGGLAAARLSRGTDQ
jgi:CubicO group peptidase (beta-lactamase class C family)